MCIKARHAIYIQDAWVCSLQCGYSSSGVLSTMKKGMSTVSNEEGDVSFECLECCTSCLGERGAVRAAGVESGGLPAAAAAGRARCGRPGPLPRIGASRAPQPDRHRAQHRG